MAFTIVKSLVAAAICFATVAQAAAPWQITDPVASTVWKSGDTVNIVWTSDGSIRASSIQIELLAGNTLFELVTKSVAPNALKTTYVVRKGFTSSDQYYLRIGTGVSDFTYSHTFSIQGDGVLVPGKLPPNTTAVITSAPASPAGAAAPSGVAGAPAAGSPIAKPSAVPSGAVDAANATAGASNSTSTAKSSAVRPVHELKSISFVIALVAAVAFWGV